MNSDKGDEPSPKKRKVDPEERSLQEEVDEPQPSCSKDYKDPNQPEEHDDDILRGWSRMCSRIIAESCASFEFAPAVSDNDELQAFLNEAMDSFVFGYTAIMNGNDGLDQEEIRRLIRGYMLNEIEVNEFMLQLAGINEAEVWKLPSKDKPKPLVAEEKHLKCRCIRCGITGHWVFQCKERVPDDERWSGRNLSEVVSRSPPQELERALIDGYWDTRELDQALLHAVAASRLEATRLLLRAGANISCRDRQRRTLFHLAIQREDNCDMLRLLLEYVTNQEDLLRTDFCGDTPLHRAAVKGAVSCMKLLVDSGVSVDAGKAKRKDTPLFKAAYSGPVRSVRWLLAHGADPSHTRSAGDATPLLEAAQACKYENVEALLEAGADVNAVDYTKSSALHYCGSRGRRDRTSERYMKAVEILVRRGCHVNAISENGETPLSVAMLEDSAEVAEYLLNHGAKVDRRTIREACAREVFLKLVLKYDPQALVPDRDFDDDPPRTNVRRMRRAAAEADLSRETVVADADATGEQTGNDVTSTEDEKTEVEKLLREAVDSVATAINLIDGMKTEATHSVLTNVFRNSSFESCCNVASMKNPEVKEKMANLLNYYNTKAELKKKLARRIYPLHWAVKSQMNTGRADVSALQFLLTHTDYGRPEFVNAPMRIEQSFGFDRSGRTPLTEACSIGLPLASLTLLQNGAEVNLPDARGCTPLTTIVGKDYIFDIIDMRLITTLAVLIQYGVDVRLPALPDYDRRMERDKSKSPEMPMCIAAKIGCLDFVQMLWLAGSGHGEVNELLRTGVRLYKATRRAFRKKKAEKIERKITSFLHSVAEQPRTLKDLARIQVRQSLGANLPDKVPQCQLPATVAEYIFVPEVEMYIEEMCRFIEKQNKEKRHSRYYWMTRPLSMAKAGVSRTRRPEQGTSCSHCEEINCTHPDHRPGRPRNTCRQRVGSFDESESADDDDDVSMDSEAAEDVMVQIQHAAESLLAPPGDQQDGNEGANNAAPGNQSGPSNSSGQAAANDNAASSNTEPGTSRSQHHSSGSAQGHSEDGGGDSDDDRQPPGGGAGVLAFMSQGTLEPIASLAVPMRQVPAHMIRMSNTQTPGGRDRHELMHLSDEDSYPSDDETDAEENSFIMKIETLQKKKDDAGAEDRRILAEVTSRLRRLDAVCSGLQSVFALAQTSKTLSEPLSQRIRPLDEPLSDLQLSIDNAKSALHQEGAASGKSVERASADFLQLLQQHKSHFANVSDSADEFLRISNNLHAMEGGESGLPELRDLCAVVKRELGGLEKALSVQLNEDQPPALEADEDWIVEDQEQDEMENNEFMELDSESDEQEDVFWEECLQRGRDDDTDDEEFIANKLLRK